MTQHTVPVAIARAFTEAWASHDLETAASSLAQDVIVDGPLAHTKGLEDYMRGLTMFALGVTGVRILAAFSDDTKAIVMYDLTTNPFGILTGTELPSFPDGKISADWLTFATFPLRREAVTGQPPSGAAPHE